jgi:hypothetical protein
MLEGGILMRIPDYQNVHGVKDINHLATKTSRVNKTHEDEFENELADCINEKKPKANLKRRKDTIKKHPALVNEGQEIGKEKSNPSNHFSSWA